MVLVVLNGRLGNRPEKKFSKNGSPYTSFSIAFSEGKKNGEGETTWYNCLWMSAEGNKILDYLDKGSLIQVTGTLLKPKPYQKKDGTYDVNLSVMVHAVNFLPSSSPKTNERGQQTEYVKEASVSEMPAWL